MTLLITVTIITPAVRKVANHSCAKKVEDQYAVVRPLYARATWLLTPARQMSLSLFCLVCLARNAHTENHNIEAFSSFSSFFSSLFDRLMPHVSCSPYCVLLKEFSLFSGGVRPVSR